MAAIMAVAATQAFAPRPTPPLAATRLAVESMHLNTIAATQSGLVAGGELGNLLLSTDRGQTWSAAKLSKDRQALINQVAFASDGRLGMAVGHEGWILRTRDAGRSWEEVAFDDNNGAPLMSVARLASGNWIAVGAFGRALRADAEGSHWTPVTLPKEVEDKHLNRVVGSADGKQWLIVGERGLLLRSRDGGENWSQLPAFYNGSFYNALALPAGGWLVYGMRGNIFRTDSFDGAWTRVDMPATASFLGHAVAPDGRIFLVGQGSLVATSNDGGAHFSLSRAEGRATLTDLVVQPDGHGWLASDAGLQPFPPRDGAQKASPKIAP